jgi:ABC-type glutathione transport system ATPase component
VSLLDVTGLTIRYGDNTVVDGVDIYVEQGESVGTLNTLRARRMGIVFQDPMQALNPYLRIGVQLKQILLSHGLAEKAEADARVIEMLAKVGLPDPGRQFRSYPYQLSGGMRQRVMIASALIAEPDLLIADEPTTALDVTVQAQILELLEELRDETALLLITHDLGVVAGHCEHTIVFERGRVVDAGPTTSLFASPGHDHTRTLLAAAPRVDRGEAPEPVSGSTLLSVGNATVSFKDLKAVSDVSFAVRRGETIAVVGESGSGKSTLVRAMLGLVPMTAGRVVYAGELLTGAVEDRELSKRRDLQLVFQDPASALNPQMRVQAIVEEPLLVHERGATRAERWSRVVAVLEKVGLEEKYLRRFPHELSGGQAQRVAIARALILDPKVLICDEAVAALESLSHTTWPSCGRSVIGCWSCTWGGSSKLLTTRNCLARQSTLTRGRYSTRCPFPTPWSRRSARHCAVRWAPWSTRRRAACFIRVARLPRRFAATRNRRLSITRARALPATGRPLSNSTQRDRDGRAVDREQALLQLRFHLIRVAALDEVATADDDRSLRVGLNDHLDDRHWNGQVDRCLGAKQK